MAIYEREARRKMIKTATYQTSEGEKTVEYDSEAPCIICGLPVMEASVGGTVICPWCDMGIHRDGSKRLYYIIRANPAIRGKVINGYEI